MDVLCHYTCEEAATKILDTAKLKFGLLAKSNDPVEIKQLWLHAEGLHSETTRDLNETMNLYRDSILRLICFSAGTLQTRTLDNEDGLIPLYNLNKHPPFYLPRTWAQYGHNHEGVCLLFSKKRLVRKFNRLAAPRYEIRIEDIKYRDFVKHDHLYNIGELLGFSRQELEKHKDKGIVHRLLRQHYRKIYMVKDNDWKDERECRALLWDKNPTDNFDDVFFDIAGLLKGVFLGVKFNPKRIDAFEEFARVLDVPLYQIKIDDNLLMAEQLI